MSYSAGARVSEAVQRPRVFRPPFMYLLGVTALTLAIISVASIFLLPNILPVTFTRAMRAGVTLSVLGVACIVALVVILWVNNRRIVVTDDRVEVRRPGQVVHTWDRATTGFGTEVTVHRTNGMRTATSRTLVAGTPQGQVKVVVPGIGRNAFNDLVAILNPIRPVQDAAAAAPRMSGRVFTPNRAPLGAYSRRFLWASLIAIVVSLLVGAAATAVIADEDAQFIALAVAGMAGILGLGLGLAGLSMRKRFRAVPHSLQAGPGWLRVDDMTYPFTTLSGIQVSPATYESKKIVLKPISGRALGWQLNGTVRGGAPVFAEWPEFIGEIVAAAAGSPGLVRLDLE